ncbi:SDR family oxidoreductase [Fulvivirga sedimenti]|uniref:SDR family oxidoreductase n=1 Tax=Fulvivirga sedimenti TaxID=2879465 RepID=A0A9X1HWJ9_9BACT|nr:SDR family oxidoreductase [Fulvivirga sedimenti]MCA6078700.1 SDR family oxidoreductase [Fulvivirga sedimenti]
MVPAYSDYIGKNVVITGGAGVICSHMAHTFASQGANVAILDIDQAAANQIAAEITNKGGSAIAIAADVLSKQSLLNARQILHDRFGPCQILINGAGGNHPKGTTGMLEHDETQKSLTSFFDLDPEGIQFVFNLNFIGTLLPTQVFAEDMVNNEGSVILNISSMNAFRPLTKIPAYSGAKAAVSNFTEWLAVYFAKSNIRVNALAPGFFLTNQNRALLLDENEQLTPRGRTILGHTPQGRFGEPEDLDGAMLWICSESARFVTGIVLPVDGGFNAFSGV